MSGSILPTTLGPLLDQGALCPQESLERELKAPTEKIPCAAPGTLVVPNPCPPLPIATEYEASSLYTLVNQSRYNEYPSAPDSSILE